MKQHTEQDANLPLRQYGCGAGLPRGKGDSRRAGGLQRLSRSERLTIGRRNSSPHLRFDPERMFQGAVADALTHVGQIAMLRRLAGARVRGENYSRAKIEIGRTGADQRAPVSEFGK